jgi:hypothetical protein
MAKFNIYGEDNNSMASRIASDALGSPSEYSNSGNPVGKGEATGNVDHAGMDYKVTVTKLGLGGKDKACTAGNHGKQGCNE